MKSLQQHIYEKLVINKDYKLPSYFKDNSKAYVFYIKSGSDYEADISTLIFNIHYVKKDDIYDNTWRMYTKDKSYFRFCYTEQPGIAYHAKVIDFKRRFYLFVSEELIKELKDLYDYILDANDNIHAEEIFKILNINNPFDDEYFSSLSKEIKCYSKEEFKRIRNTIK